MRLRVLLALVTLLFLLVGCGEEGKNVTRELQDLGIPLLETYTNDSETQIRARSAWDMVAYDGKIYIGCGDYDTNMGPVSVWSYDVDGGAWQASSPLEDEHIKRYAVLRDTLSILGTDPRGDWSMGSYYTLEGDEWIEHRVLPSGIHCFDAVEYGGKLFFGLGVNSGDSPVVTSEDGEAFSPIAFLRDGAPVDTTPHTVVRVHNFSVYEGTLYAFLTVGSEEDVAFEIYRYDGESFSYFSTPPEVFLRSYDITYTGEFAGLATFINGYCYYISEDMVNFRPWRVEMSDLASDVMVIDGIQYVLAHTALDNGRYESAVYTSTDGKTFTKLFWFRDKIPANSFTYADGVFYFAMGRYYDYTSPETGRVCALNYTIEK